MPNLTNLATSLIFSVSSAGEGLLVFTVGGGDGALYPNDDFYVTLHPEGVFPNRNNSEIVHVTQRTNNEFSALRAQRGTTEKNVQSGWRVSLSAYAEDFDAKADVTYVQQVQDKSFTQNFSGATSVTVNHNLGKRPAVLIVDTAGDEIWTDVKHINVNTLQVSFSAPSTGTIICN